MIHVVYGIAGGFVEVLTGAESALACAGDHNPANGEVAVQLRERGDQRFAHARVDRVQGGRAIQGNDGGGTTTFHQHWGWLGAHFNRRCRRSKAGSAC
jgi:hypothetical protein